MGQEQHILFIDDEQELLDVYVELFIDEGFKCWSTTNPWEAIKIAKDENIDIVICDEQMPDMKGHEVLKRLRDNGYESPFYFMTAYLYFTETEAKTFGATGVIAKPYDVDYVIDRLKND